MRNCTYTPFADLSAHEILKLYRCVNTRHLFLKKTIMHRLDRLRGPRNNPRIAFFDGYWVSNPGVQLTIEDALRSSTNTEAASRPDVQSVTNAATTQGA